MPIFASNFASNSLSGAVRVTNGFANITLATIPYALEGDKSFVIKIRKDSTAGEVLAVTPTLNFRENGSFVDFSANTSTVSEGGLVAFTVTTANVTNGANLFYSIFPVTANVTADDFTANTGSFTITNNAGTFVLQARADTSLVDETGENFRLQLRSASPTGNIIYTSSNITILDTYKTYNVLTFAPTAVNTIESSNITFTFSATNIPLPTTLYYDTTGNATVTSNTGSFTFTGLSNTITVFADAVGSGEIKSFVLNLRTGSNTGPIVATSNSAYVLDSSLAYMNATGGEYAYTIYDPLTNTGYKVHKFLSSNNFTITRAGATPTFANIEILMVAGGGGGGVTQYPGTPPGGIGAGGAGGLLYYGTKTVKTANGPLLTTNASSTYAIVVGAGGTNANAGSNTSFLINSNVVYRAVGGGGGTLGINGGSGGAGGTGISGQGNPGGPSSSQYAAAGGGGAGGAGSPGFTRPWPSYPAFPQGVAGAGGAGLGYDIEGIYMTNNYGLPSTKYYAGGGGGGTQSGASAGSLGADGGIGGGGPSGSNGTAGTGGGAGGGYAATGGGGIVIISYPYVPLPEYVSLTTSFGIYTEGDQIAFTLNANFVPNNTLLYYSTLGNVTASNFVGGNTGSFRTTLNSTTFTLTSNTNIPDNETRFFQLQIRDDPGTSSNALITSSGNSASTITIFDTALAPPPLEILLVGGGGGGGSASNWAAGGGAGGVLYYGANTTPKTPNGNVVAIAAQTLYTVTLGAGGAAGANGGNTFISAPGGGVIASTAVGGGRGGGGAWSPTLAGNGGSGGGGSQNSAPGSTIIGAFPGGSGISGQGNAGGNGYSPGPSGGVGTGGGGGALSVGSNGGSGVAGNGGTGIGYNLVGSMTYYGGGGAGTTTSSGQGAAGQGGGGSGGPGTVNTGGGGGVQASSGTGFAGGPGIAIIRYPDTKANAITTGSPNLIISGGFKTYRFWQSGTFIFS